MRACCHAAGDEEARWFSFDPSVHVEREQMMCYLTHTTAETHKLIQENLKVGVAWGRLWEVAVSVPMGSTLCC
jgi:tRNA U34 5-carboxymethylaminomethyl modifying enzyme MnmG/GidA